MDKLTLTKKLTDLLCPCFGECAPCRLNEACGTAKIIDKIVKKFEEGYFEDSIDTEKENCTWKDASIELPLNESSTSNTIGVIVYTSDSSTPTYRIFERAVVRGKTTFRWKYPWDRISDEKITYWRYLPERE